jgi:crotonobetainyl-CoA:carnitine CoA-transferase CaiB-like acyl-CoA transferase
VQAPVPRFSGQEGIVDGLGPALGAHTSEVLTEVLGLGEPEQAGLRGRHVI